jgi:DNA processing protein
MTQTLSPNTQAILLLTAPLIAGRNAPATDLLTPGEYKRLARRLRDHQHQPADLLAADADEAQRSCEAVVDRGRLQRLLGRGFLLSQVVERWQSRAIWVVSRADGNYPRRLKNRLREDAPPVIYGCGDAALVEFGGLAVVGSRNVDDGLIDFTESIGRLAAQADRGIVSGGAKGVDQAAMRGALNAGGIVCGVLADSLEKSSMNREYRNRLLDGQLVLISPYDPSAGFNVGHAMQRNKLIYALADAALVVNADLNKGGTWAGAVEQLDKLRLVPIFVRSTAPVTPGLDALHRKGASLWPDAERDVIRVVFDTVAKASESTSLPPQSLFSEGEPDNGREEANAVLETRGPSSESFGEVPVSTGSSDTPSETSVVTSASTSSEDTRNRSDAIPAPIVARDPPVTPAEAVFRVVTDQLRELLSVPMKEADVAAALDVSTAQAKQWLQRLVEQGVIEKHSKPAGYMTKQKQLFE